MTLEQALEKLHKEIDELGYSPAVYNIYDNDDMILFAIKYLIENVEDAFVETNYLYSE